MIRIDEKRRPVLRCQACGLLFYAVRKDSIFCDRRCYNRNLRRRHVLDTQLGAKEIPLTREIIDMRESIFRAATYHAKLYSVTSVDLGVSFPLPGDPTRSTGLLGKLPYYQLDPFEFPMVPLEGLYSVRFYTRSGCEVKREDQPLHELLILYTYKCNPKKAPIGLRAAIKQILIDRNPPAPLPRLPPKSDKPSLAKPPAKTDNPPKQLPASTAPGVGLARQPKQLAGRTNGGRHNTGGNSKRG